MTSKKSGKLMVASSTALSARYDFLERLKLLPDALVSSNLFAIEYLREHPMTTKPQFKKIWDNIASETKKVCKQHYHILVMCSFFTRSTKR